MWTKLIHRNEIWKNLNNEEQKLDLSEVTLNRREEDLITGGRNVQLGLFDTILPRKERSLCGFH